MSYPIAVLVGALIFAAAGAWETALVAIAFALAAVAMGENDQERGGDDE